MNSSELKSGDFLYFKYDSETIAYFYIDKITDNEIYYLDIRVLHRRQQFVYSYETCDKVGWNDRDFIFTRFSECDKDISVLIEYIFDYKIRVI